MPDILRFQPFVTAQDAVLTRVRRELSEGQKRSHWMRYVFPQLRSPDHSPMARLTLWSRWLRREPSCAIRFPVPSGSFCHPVLGPRLVELTDLVNKIDGRSIQQILGSPDGLKFRSFARFAVTDPDALVFQAALAKYFDNVPDSQRSSNSGNLRETSVAGGLMGHLLSPNIFEARRGPGLQVGPDDHRERLRGRLMKLSDPRPWQSS